MLNRALIQPDPAIIFGMVADLMHAAGAATSLEDLFLQLEDVGILFRVDRAVFPTMARTPTLAMWELEQLRTIEDVVRRGHIYTVSRGRIDFADGSVAVAQDAVFVNCTAEGIKMPALVDIGGRSRSRCSPSCRLPVLRRRAHGVRRGDPKRRRGQEPTLPSGAVAEHPGRLGEDAGRRHPELDVVQLGAGHQGMG